MQGRLLASSRSALQLQTDQMSCEVWDTTAGAGGAPAWGWIQAGTGTPVRLC